MNISSYCSLGSETMRSVYCARYMRILLIFLFAFALLLSCDSRNTSDGRFSENDRAVLTYEGRIVLNRDENLYVILSLRGSDEAGSGRYQLSETYEASDGYHTLPLLTGAYSFEATTEGAIVVRMQQSGRDVPIKRMFINPTDNKVYEENFRDGDLTIIRSDDMTTATIINLRSQRIDPSNEPILVRRTSRPFTIEGYFTHMGDTSRFEEINTRELWAVSKLGIYYQVLRQYHELASEKYERIYFKGVGYSVVNARGGSDHGDALVLQRVAQMTSAPMVE